MRIVIICAAGVLLDRIFGDPVWLYHPVRMMGLLISALERILRRLAGDHEKRLVAAGAVMWVLVAGASVGVPAFLLYLAGRFCTEIGTALEIFWCYQLLAAKSLRVESGRVYDKLVKEDLPGARRAVSMIVGRDTQALTAEGVTKAAVETVAENTNDGVIAPLVYMLLLGPLAGFFYKAVNTMDSMVGYKNEKYLYFGRAAARLDDVAGYIPARISAGLMILSAFLLGMDGRNAARIWRRDGRKHASPNAAQTEAACAGALGLELAGNAYYFGKLYEKETIGEPVRLICPEDIIRANRLMYLTEFLTLLIFGGLRILLLWIL